MSDAKDIIPQGEDSDMTQPANQWSLEWGLNQGPLDYWPGTLSIAPRTLIKMIKCSSPYKIVMTDTQLNGHPHFICPKFWG